MASFTPDDGEDADFELLRGGAITLFRRGDLFESTIEQLVRLGYRVHRIAAHAREPFVTDLTEALRFHANFGYTPWTGNLDALNDAFRYMEFRSDRGVAFAFQGIDALHCVEPRLVHETLEIFQTSAQDHLLVGHRLVGIAQSDDPDLTFRALGCSSAKWNRREALAADGAG